jgi:DNA-binding transcriptional ArsR family regulator
MSPEYATSDLSINVLNLKKSAHMVRAINHTLRRQILFLIHENKRMTVSTIYGKLGLEQSVASQHLSILRNAGFVHTEREGKFIFYSVNYPRIKQINQSTDALLSKK